jgi:hypothetical protein
VICQYNREIIEKLDWPTAAITVVFSVPFLEPAVNVSTAKRRPRRLKEKGGKSRALMVLASGYAK